MNCCSSQSSYPLGVDPIWHGRKTELPYMNSMKMKMSILIGVTHMNFGILMSLFNNMDTRCAGQCTLGAYEFQMMVSTGIVAGISLHSASIPLNWCSCSSSAATMRAGTCCQQRANSSPK